MIQELDPNVCVAWAMNPRKRFEKKKLLPLVDSMRAVGWFGSVVGRPLPDGRTELVFGECRLRAALEAGLRVIAVDVREDLSDKDAIELAVIENRDREDLDVIEEAGGYRSMVDLGWSVAEIACRSGKSERSIYDAIELLNLDKDIKTALRDGQITKRTSRAIQLIDDEEMRKEALRRVLEPVIQDFPLTERQALTMLENEYLKSQKRKKAWEKHFEKFGREDAPDVVAVRMEDLKFYVGIASTWKAVEERPESYRLSVVARKLREDEIPTWGELAERHGAIRAAVPDDSGNPRYLVDAAALEAAEIANAEAAGPGAAAGCIFPLSGVQARHEQSRAAKAVEKDLEESGVRSQGSEDKKEEEEEDQDYGGGGQESEERREESQPKAGSPVSNDEAELDDARKILRQLGFEEGNGFEGEVWTNYRSRWMGQVWVTLKAPFEDDTLGCDWDATKGLDLGAFFKWWEERSAEKHESYEKASAKAPKKSVKKAKGSVLVK